MTFINSNIPASPVYGVYISQLVRHSRACDQYSDFLDGVQQLTKKLLERGYVAPRLRSSLKKFPRSSSEPGWPQRNIHISNDNESFTVYIDLLFPLSQPRNLQDWTVHMGNTAGVLSESRNYLPFVSTRVYPGFLVGSVLLIFQFFMLSFYVSIFIDSCCDGRYDFRVKRCSVRLYLQLFVRRLMSYLRFFAHSVSQTYCAVILVCFRFSWVLQVSLGSPFLSAVFSNVYLMPSLLLKCLYQAG